LADLTRAGADAVTGVIAALDDAVIDGTAR
jgi:hypothetical protein